MMEAQLAQGGSGSDARLMMQYDANKKSVAAAYVLWFFLGMFGAHRFYCGATGSGAAILVLTMASLVLSVVGIGLVLILVPAVWVMVDAFLIPAMIREHNTRLASRLSA